MVVKKQLLRPRFSLRCFIIFAPSAHIAGCCVICARITGCVITEVKRCFEHIPHKLHDPREHVRGMVPCTHGLSRSSVANVPRLLLLCAFLPARRFVAWNALRLADDGDALDAAIDKLVVPVLPQSRDGLVLQLFLQRSCIFNCHLESS